MTESRTVEVTSREEMGVRAAIRQNGGFILQSTIIGNVVREGVSLGSGYRITYMVYPR
jgi:hypothetical protein